MKKGIWVGLVAIAFVIGTMTTGTVAYAAVGGQGSDAIVQALQSVVSAINGINPTVNIDPTPVSVNVNVPPAEVQVIGIQGPPGILRTYVVADDFEAGGGFNAHRILCESGDMATGGGYFLLQGAQKVRVTAPLTDADAESPASAQTGETPIGWEFVVVDDSTPGFVKGWVVCADMTP